MEETHAERLLDELLDRGLVPGERIEEVQRIRESGEIWGALEYAMNGEISERWRSEAVV
ncbi:hypothetical protein [Halobaculum rubrum]|uniref:hypothetical protein n=1 Tax=Halobaculum rubrum TaxID=2872158 RepID=UPI001CA3C380|nr:hypothetical protein [Halobaculum rubrum]QZX99056.1 hypothetical protein K6T25_12445 [Halobaculum rubrum]